MPAIKHLIPLALAVVTSGVFALPSQTREPRKQPNILFLLADDMGYGELGSFGQRSIKTPYLDKLARDGVRLTDFYIGSSVCSPSRAVLLTGIHAGQVSIRGNKGYLPEHDSSGRVSLKKSEITLAEMLAGGGYQTAFFGKWHLGNSADRSTWAEGRGFEYAMQEQWANKTDTVNTFVDGMHYTHDGKEIFYDKDEHDCLDTFRTDLAIDFLKNHRDEERPLFLFMSYRTPHSHEPFIREKMLYANEGWPDIERQHAARITMLDREIKRLLDRLDNLGELENTLVIFTSDNGSTIEGSHDYNFFNSSAGMRGFKRHLHEGGIRVPCIAYWPNGGVTGGRVSNHICTGYDVMPTLAEIAGIDAPAQTTGISFLPELVGKKQPEHEFIYFELHELGIKQAVRAGKWKAVRFKEAGRTELYNLEKDRNEIIDVSYANPKVVKKMEAIMKKESLPTPNYPSAGNFFPEEDS